MEFLEPATGREALPLARTLETEGPEFRLTPENPPVVVLGGMPKSLFIFLALTPLPAVVGRRGAVGLVVGMVVGLMLIMGRMMGVEVVVMGMLAKKEEKRSDCEEREEVEELLT
jgi:hypothetical protein